MKIVLLLLHSRYLIIYIYLQFIKAKIYVEMGMEILLFKIHTNVKKSTSDTLLQEG